MAGKEGTAGVRCTSGDTRRGAGFDKDTCSAGFFKNGKGGGGKERRKKKSFGFDINLSLGKSKRSYYKAKYLTVHISLRVHSLAKNTTYNKVASVNHRQKQQTEGK